MRKGGSTDLALGNILGSNMFNIARRGDSTRSRAPSAKRHVPTEPVPKYELPANGTDPDLPPGERVRSFRVDRCGPELVSCSTNLRQRSPVGKKDETLSEAPHQATSRAARRTLPPACALGLASSLGCTPTVSVFGVYFPGWLISAVVGLVAAYALVWWLGRRPGTRALAQSGLLFCSLALSAGLAVWSVFFGGF